MWINRHIDDGPTGRPSEPETVLVRAAVALAESLTVDEVLETLARELIGALPRAAECSISTWDAVCDELVVHAVAYAQEWPPEEERGKRFPLDDFPALRRLLEQRSGYVEYRATDPSLPAEVREQLSGWLWQTWVTFPLVVGGQAVGVVEIVDYTTAEAWEARDVEICQALASLAAVAIRNAQLVAELRLLADRDPLTGLLNHRAFYEALEAEHARSVRNDQPLAVLIVDLDDFKRHNDRHGHLHGDQTLRDVAATITAVTRTADIVGRIGGDEFALALPDASVADVEAIAHRLISSLQQRTGLTASVGVTLNPRRTSTYLEVVELADDALRLAKNAGKRTVQVAAAA